MSGVARFLLLFAREPAREAREKGFASPEAAELFAGFARGWRAAARAAGAGLVVVSPPEDLAAWRARLAPADDVSWIVQRGASLGERLENAAIEAARLGGHALIVGGDISPASFSLDAAFGALERGADAVLAPALDGGISLVGLRKRDLDLLRGIAPRRRDVCEALGRRLNARGRRVEQVWAAPDVDSRRSLRALLRALGNTESLRFLVRRALVGSPVASTPRPAFVRPVGFGIAVGLRAPPAFA
jgi:glycosyltransferase A (GT-A) superfamily protein (DUF2064 family)